MNYKFPGYKAMKSNTNITRQGYFNGLTSWGFLIKNDDLDLIALFAIYGDILRAEFGDFVVTWNRYCIRNQPNRPHVVPGMPNELYINPPNGAIDWRVNIQPNISVHYALDIMLEPLWDIDIESFLIPETA